MCQLQHSVYILLEHRWKAIHEEQAGEVPVEKLSIEHEDARVYEGPIHKRLLIGITADHKFLGGEVKPRLLPMRERPKDIGRMRVCFGYRPRGQARPTKQPG